MNRNDDKDNNNNTNDDTKWRAVHNLAVKWLCVSVCARDVNKWNGTRKFIHSALYKYYLLNEQSGENAYFKKAF